MSNLVNHAKRELELLGEDPEFADSIIKAVEGFANYGHSGGSASAGIQILIDLLQFKNLTPLTDDPDEWIQHAPEVVGLESGVWQNVRNSEAFSNNNGRHYYLLSEGASCINPWPRHETVKKKL